jgi:acetylornithine/succinyldiaminopimelate/putrescine aminotransferase
MDRGLLDHVREVGAHLERRLRTLALQHPVVSEVRGLGLMFGLQLRTDALPIIDMARSRGLLVNRTDEKVVRMLPPLVIEAGEIDRAVDILDGVFAAVESEVPA